MSKFYNQLRVTNTSSLALILSTVLLAVNAILTVKSVLLLNITELLRNILFNRITITMIGGQKSKINGLLYTFDSRALPMSSVS